MADDADPRTTYLTRVATGLRLSDALDREVVEELAGHIDDSVHALQTEGLDPSMARREALARLGDPDELASGLRRARQTRRRLLVAAGYGVVASLSGAFWAYLFAVVVTILCTLSGVAIVTAIIKVFGLGVSSWGATSALAIPTLWFVAAFAGRRACAAVARRSFRDRADVAPGIAIVGGALIAMVTVFWWRGHLDPALVVALVGAPVLFAAGALAPIERATTSGRIASGGWQILTVLAVGTALVVAAGLLTIEAPVNGYDQDFAVIGQAWPVTIDGMTADGDVVASSDLAPRVITIDPPSAFDGLRDLRLEAWPLTSEWGPIDPTATEPVATGSLEQTSPGTYEGVVALEPLHQTAWYVVATTGLGADGVRYQVATDQPVTSPPWVGTAWEWLTGR